MALTLELESSLPRWRRTIAGLAVVALACKLALAWCTVGTNDMRTWEADLQVITSEGGPAVYKQLVPIYEDGKVAHKVVFNHPPLMISVLRVWGWLAEQTGVPFRFWLRATSSLADLGTLALLYLAARSGVWRVGGPALCVLAASPVALFVSGFHGNSDPIMIFLVVGSAFLLERGHHVVGSGLLLGLAMEIKIVPVLLVPAMLLMLPSYRQRVIWCASAACTALLPALPYSVVALRMAKNIFGYPSNQGVWGLSYLYEALSLPYSNRFPFRLEMGNVGFDCGGRGLVQLAAAAGEPVSSLGHHVVSVASRGTGLWHSVPGLVVALAGRNRVSGDGDLSRDFGVLPRGCLHALVWRNSVGLCQFLSDKLAWLDAHSASDGVGDDCCDYAAVSVF